MRGERKVPWRDSDAGNWDDVDKSPQKERNDWNGHSNKLIQLNQRSLLQPPDLNCPRRLVLLRRSSVAILAISAILIVKFVGRRRHFKIACVIYLYHYIISVSPIALRSLSAWSLIEELSIIDRWSCVTYLAICFCRFTTNEGTSCTLYLHNTSDMFGVYP